MWAIHSIATCTATAARTPNPSVASQVRALQMEFENLGSDALAEVAERQDPLLAAGLIKVSMTAHRHGMAHYSGSPVWFPCTSQVSPGKVTCS